MFYIMASSKWEGDRLNGNENATADIFSQWLIP